MKGWYPNSDSPKTSVLGSTSPTYPVHSLTKFNLRVAVKLHGVFLSSRGLTCIFTGTSISPGPSLRQCASRYTFRAGRNLPDKEFRYLRTVIVTAAVYWGSIQSFDRSLTPPLNLPAPGRCQHLYISFRFSRHLCLW